MFPESVVDPVPESVNTLDPLALSPMDALTVSFPLLTITNSLPVPETNPPLAPPPMVTPAVFAEDVTKMPPVLIVVVPEASKV